MIIRLSSDFFIRVLFGVFWAVLFFSFLYMPLLFQQQKRSINVFSWTEMIDPQEIAEFEKKHGIKVNIAYYESNEELYAKLTMTKGAGYDLIIPSDYMVEQLIHDNYLQKIDTSKLTFIKDLHPRLLNKYYDPHNAYSIPYLWSIYGIGINKHYFDNTIPDMSWGLLFDMQTTAAPRVMIEDARELILLCLYYMFKTIDNIDKDKLMQIAELLKKQKKYVVAYTDVGASYLLNSGQGALALATSPYIFRTMLHTDYIDFIVPTEGTFMVLENMVIPASSKRADLVYEFINFLYDRDKMQARVASTYFFPPLTTISYASMPSNVRFFFEMQDMFLKKIQFFRNVIDRSIVNDIWIELKV